ncbi:uncharacterized protein LOC143179708 [Calliopsis andreniformis]|uniref:uncharacterized protein LOC143179708 n=1 Tax=Calliopsis andreniformis TaxID=337506 RepID=UPI003FCDEA37
MARYLTRKHTSSNTQESRVKDNMTTKKQSPQIKPIIKEAARVKNEGRIRSIRSTRLMTRSKNALTSQKIDVSKELDKDISQEDKQETSGHKKLGMDNYKKKTAQTRKVITRSKASKEELKSTKHKNASSNVNKSLRQTSLQESFTKQVRIGLRRKKENSLVKEYLSPKHQKSVVVVNRVSMRKRKVPVYKCVSPENSPASKTEIYEFKFDINDSKEKLPKKRKKRNIVKKTVVPKRKKKIVENQNIEKIPEVLQKEPPNKEMEKIKEEEKRNGEENPSVNIETKIIKENSPSEHLKNSNSVETAVENEIENNLKEKLEDRVESNKEESFTQSMLKTSDNINEEEPVNKIITKPTIVSVQDLNNKKIKIMDNSQISNSTDFKSSESTMALNNKLNIQHKNVVNNSLFEKSLSPIAKASENVNLSSPWRTPRLLTFSQVRNVFQSTPQRKEYEVFGRRLTRPTFNDSKSYGNITKPRDVSQKNDENVSIEGHANTSIFKKKNPASSRKFGTEITNLEHSVQSNLMDDKENLSPNIQSNIIHSKMSNTSRFDNTENKENSMLSCESPKRVSKKELKSVKVSTPQNSPLKSITNIRSNEEKENFDPQPGPSGLQTNKVFNENRVLRQSNLNSFLNIMEMPQSTTIKTPHGIFDDAHSTPVNRKPVMKLTESNVELQNAFGFDDDSNQNISPIEHEVINDKDKTDEVILQKASVKPFARISLGELKNNLLPNKPVENIKTDANIQYEKTEVKKSPIKVKQKPQIDIANFSDTFDVLSEMGESAVESVSNVPLFADLEPSHFTQPPKRSYKRKRAVKFNGLEDTSDEEREEIFEHEKKRKRGDKMKKDQEKRLLEWVQDINRTFDEIDKYELVVE